MAKADTYSRDVLPLHSHVPGLGEGETVLGEVGAAMLGLGRCGLFFC